mmetsp:Transcript_31627/g.58408  ORF Transcript_31627/g.58408 Transcript_31627/m.58408 type:complete len:428 (+) Transcript_31627:248-1531(+)
MMLLSRPITSISQTMNTQRLARMHVLFLSLFLFLTMPSSASAWVPQTKVNTQPFNKPRRIRGRGFSPVGASNPRSNNQRRDSTLSMLSLDQVPEIIQAFFSETASVNPLEEAAVLNDLAEVSSDLVIMFAPETIILRLSAVIEKILELTSDYIPDHSIRSDELAFNIPIMATSIFLLSRSVVPIFKAQFVELTELDHIVYELCFQPVGVTLLQFKCMKATGCFEWITYKAGTLLIDENDYIDVSLAGDDDGEEDGNDKSSGDWKYLFWQLDGDVIRSFRGSVFGFIERTNGKHIDNPGAQGLLGDTRFLYNLEEERRGKQKKTQDSRNDDTSNYQLHPIATITIGPKGATLLRIDSHKLFDLMDHDERLESSIRLLLLKSLKLKIGNLLFAQQQQRESNSNNVSDYFKGDATDPADKEDKQHENEAL